MTMWIPSLAGRDGPRYRAIADALAADVADGRLAAGARLPTHRDLADRLGVTVGTVSRAYAEAQRRGLVAGEVGRGTFVRGAAPAPARYPFVVPESRDPHVVDFGLNVPAWELAAARLGPTLETLARSADLTALTRHQPDVGRPTHRAAGAAWIGQLGLDVPADRVAVTSGVQHGILAALLAVARPGDTVLTESLTFPGFEPLAEHLDLRVHGLAMDGEGVLPDAFEAACRSGSPKALYCIPTHHNPTTATMSEGRRRAVAEVARRHGVAIIEDDVYGFHPAERAPPLAAFAPECTVLVVGTSKCLAGGLRVGFLVAPPEWMERIATAIRFTTWSAPPLPAEVVARWITDGTADELIAWQRRELAARQDLARRLLPPGLHQAEPTSFHAWLTLPEPWRGEAFAAALRRRGVLAASAETFTVGRGPTPDAVRLCLCGVAERDDVERGLTVVADVLARPPGVAVI